MDKQESKKPLFLGAFRSSPDVAGYLSGAQGRN